jgi:hypothetical protein
MSNHLSESTRSGSKEIPEQEPARVEAPCEIPKKTL